MMNHLKDERGQALVISVLGMSCLVGFAALATDVGMMLREKRLVQTAADAAAIAGASELNYGDVSAAATAAATSNGFTAGANTVVTISSPPADGPHAGAAGYVEAIVTQTQPTVLLNFFGLASMKVSARAVAMNGGSAQGCIYVMSPNASPALELQGSFDVSAPTCGVEVNSKDPDALNFTGAGGTLTAGSVGVVGGDGGQTGDSTPAPVTGIAPFSDPITYTPPAVTPTTKTTTIIGKNGKKTTTTTTTYSVTDSAGTTVNCPAPTGTLTGTLTAASSLVCYSGNVTLSNVTLGNATYVFTGDGTNTVTFSGTVSTPSSGTTIDIDAGTLSIATNTTMNLTAPPDGGTLVGGGVTPYGGVVLMQPSSNNNTITLQKGDAFGSLTGIIWAPSAQLFLNDSGGDKSGGITLTTDLVVGTLNDKTATLTMKSYSQSVGTSPLTRIALVE